MMMLIFVLSLCCLIKYDTRKKGETLKTLPVRQPSLGYCRLSFSSDSFFEDEKKCGENNDEEEALEEGRYWE
jgi:hypothetical protein